ncbi:MAG: discoidin domain-containing protein [Armatimonadetes bacterium]|nr:discoidin domain-containing protein [Armatimonadota bacterium]
MRLRQMVAIVIVAMFALSAAGALAAPKTVAGAVDLVAAANGGRVVAVSSEARDKQGHVLPQWAAKNLIDQKYVVGTFVPPDSYGWSSATPPTPDKPEWIVFAFKKDETRLINRIVIDPTTQDPPVIGRWVRDVELQVSTTTPNGPYKAVGRFIVVNRPIKQTFEFPPVEARYVRLVVLSNHGSDKCVEMGEFEVYEAIVGEDELDRLIIRLENLLQDLKRYRDGVLYQQRRAIIEAVTEKKPPAQGGQRNKPKPPAQGGDGEQKPAGDGGVGG